MSFKITELFAFVAIDDDGEDEGVIAIMRGGRWYPAVGADMARVESLRPHVQEVVNQTGKRVELRKFATMERLEVIEPEEWRYVS